MTLRQALQLQGNSIQEVNDIISEMIESIDNGCDPEELLEEYNLEPDYVMDLLKECV